MKILLFITVIFCQAVLAQQKDFIVPASNLIAEGIPPIPASIANEVLRYSESRSAGFSAWHPKRTEMIINTRFANVRQLHQVKMPMGARKQVTFFNEPVINAFYEPLNGKYFLFTKDIGGNEFTQIYRYDIMDGKATMITDGGRTQNGNIIWNNKGDLIAYSSTRRNGADRDIYIMAPEKPGSDKIILQVQGGGWNIQDWSPDDKFLLLGENISANESHFWLLEIATGIKKELTPRNEKNIANRGANFDKDGKGIYFTTDRDNEFSRLAYIDLNIKKINYLTSDIPWDVDRSELSDDGKKLAFTTNEAGHSKLYILNTATKEYKAVNTLPQGVYSLGKFHTNNSDLALTINSARSASDIYVVNTVSNEPTRWTESEMGGLIPEELSIPSLIKWKSVDNMEISGFYYQPPKKFTGKRPVMIDIHGGPEGQSKPYYIGSANYFLNEMGVAIIYPNVRGSSGYGKTFLKADNGTKREESVKDIAALLDWIAQQPDLDTSRVMIIGGSYGGYMTLAVATNYNERIRCAIDIVGISNFNTFLKNTESYRRDLRRVEYGDERDSTMAAYFERIAPLNNAQKITKPLFIIQGGNDPRVPRTEAVQMADKVRSNSSVVWYLEAKDEGHGFSKKNNIDFQNYAIILFMRKYLTGD